MSVSIANCQVHAHTHFLTYKDINTQACTHASVENTALYLHRVLCAGLQRRGKQQRFPRARSPRRPERWSGCPPCPGQKDRSPPGAQQVPPQAAGPGRAGCRGRAAGLAAPTPWPQPPRDGADSRHHRGEGGAHTPEATRAEQSRAEQDKTVRSSSQPQWCESSPDCSVALPLSLLTCPLVVNWASCVRQGNTVDSLHSACCWVLHELHSVSLK